MRPHDVYTPPIRCLSLDLLCKKINIPVGTYVYSAILVISDILEAGDFRKAEMPFIVLPLVVNCISHECYFPKL